MRVKRWGAALLALGLTLPLAAQGPGGGGGGGGGGRPGGGQGRGMMGGFGVSGTLEEISDAALKVKMMDWRGGGGGPG
ncbi:MAG: hypothetical protein IT204_04080, partial [Fimbriimonadaceae bacterium]|nr:hypothetical protein [Fimbriimonadaceae bacterium]